MDKYRQEKKEGLIYKNRHMAWMALNVAGEDGNIQEIVGRFFFI